MLSLKSKQVSQCCNKFEVRKVVRTRVVHMVWRQIMGIRVSNMDQEKGFKST